MTHCFGEAYIVLGGPRCLQMREYVVIVPDLPLDTVSQSASSYSIHLTMPLPTATSTVELNSFDPSAYLLSFSNLSYTVKTKQGTKRLTDDVSLEVQGGEMVGE